MTQPRKRSRAKPEVRRSQIIEEAFRIVGEYGYHGFTVQGLAKRCGLTNAGLLHYFGSKDGLLLALLDHIEVSGEAAVGPLISGLHGNVRTAEDTMAAIVQIMCAMVAPVIENPEQARFVFVLRSEAMEPSHPAHDWFARRDGQTVDFLIDLLTPVVGQPQPVARQLVAALNGVVGQSLQADLNFDLNDESERLFAIIIAAQITGR